jgi:hypothetical protein
MTVIERRRRPGVLRWLWYAFGGALPARFRTWVLHDVSARTWVARHLARATLQIAPIGILLFVLVPGSGWVRTTAAVGGTLLGFFYSVAFIRVAAEYRVLRAGYPYGNAALMRESARAAARRRGPRARVR